MYIFLSVFIHFFYLCDLFLVMDVISNIQQKAQADKDDNNTINHLLEKTAGAATHDELFIFLIENLIKVFECLVSHSLIDGICFFF